MSKTYLVKLKPLDWFFFGGEKTFGDGKNEYLARSNKMPQQSAIIGMLRYQLLKQKGWLNDANGKSTAPADAVVKLIGASSFSMSGDNNFGAIKAISPICICSGEQMYTPLPKDNEYTLQLKGVTRAYLNGEKTNNNLVQIEKFDHKASYWLRKWSCGSGEAIDDDAIWETRMQIGITKPRNGDSSNEKSFYKQEVCRLIGAFQFAFWVELDEELTPDKVFIGAQRSCFDMTVTPVDGDTATLETCYIAVTHIKEPTAAHKIVLLSDAYVADINVLNNHCLFHWSDTIPFRNMETTTNGKWKSGYTRYKRIDTRYNLLERGSVLYFETDGQRTELEKILKQEKLQKAGYNIYQVKLNNNENK